MHKSLVAVVTLCMMGLLFAFAIPSMIDASEDPQYDTLTLQEGETVTVTEGLEMTLDNSGQGEATVTLSDTDTGRTNTSTITEGNTSAWSLPGGQGNVTNKDSTASEATLRVEYPGTYGWNDSAVVITDNIGLLLIIIALLTVMGGMMVVLRA